MGKEGEFYEVYVCEKHGKGKGGFLLAKALGRKIRLCQVSDCSEKAKWLVMIIEESEE